MEKSSGFQHQDTRFPGWRRQRPANSSSRITVSTAAAGAPSLTDQFIDFHRGGPKRFFDLRADAVGFGFQRSCDRRG